MRSSRATKTRRGQSPTSKRRIPAGQFKATCLALMDEVQRTGTPLTVTKHGVPIVQVIPAIDPTAPGLFGRLKGTAQVTGDIVAPIDIEWDVLADD